MSWTVKWTLAISCLAAVASGVLREAKVRTALHLQCREGQVISVESATLVSGQQRQQQQQQHESLTSSTAATAAGEAWNASLSQPAAVRAAAAEVSAATTFSATSATVASVELRCQHAYDRRDEDYRVLVRRCSGHSSCSGIVSPSDLTMLPCGRQFGSDPNDYVEVNYNCVDLSDVSDICDNTTKTLFRGYIRSPAYPETLSPRVGEASASAGSSTGRLRCSCMLAAQNYAAIELLLLDVADSSASTWRLELAPAHGRPIVRLCAGNQTAPSPATASQPLAGTESASGGCANRRMATSYSRLTVTFTLTSGREESVGGQSSPPDKARFFLSYSARELGRIVSTCQLLEGSSTANATPEPTSPDDARPATVGGLEPVPENWTTAAADRPAEEEQLSDVEESDRGIAVVVGALVPSLFLFIVVATIGARAAWIYHRKKRWRNRSWSVLPSICRRCCVPRSNRLSFAPIVGRAFDGVVYAMPGGAGKCCTLHTYDEAARSSCPADCDDDHYDTIPGHHHYQDVEFGCRHYETLPDGVCAAVSKRSSYTCEAGGRPGKETGAAVSLVLLDAQPPSSSSSSSSASSSETGQPPVVCVSTSTLYEVLGDCSAGTASPSMLRGSCSSISVRSLGIDFSDVVAESLKRMSTPMFPSVTPCNTNAPGIVVEGAAAQVQSEDYLSPMCSHRDGSCCHAHPSPSTSAAR